MCDVSLFWDLMMADVMKAYHKWLNASPMDRLAIRPEVVVEDKYKRLEARITNMMVAAVPATLKQEALAARDLIVAGLLFRALKTFQPGGLHERAQTLATLTTVQPAKNVTACQEALRQWQRQLRRAEELQLALPDPLLMVHALTELTKTVTNGDKEMAFRVSTFRMNARVDTGPTMESVNDLLQLLIAEVDHALHASKTTSKAGGEKDKEQDEAKIKAMKAGTPEKTEKVFCKYWGSDNGRRKGKDCTYPHPWDASIVPATSTRPRPVRQAKMRSWSFSTSRVLKSRRVKEKEKMERDNRREKVMTTRKPRRSLR